MGEMEFQGVKQPIIGLLTLIFRLTRKMVVKRLLASKTGSSVGCFLPWVVSCKLNERDPWQLQSNH